MSFPICFLRCGQEGLPLNEPDAATFYTKMAIRLDFFDDSMPGILGRLFEIKYDYCQVDGLCAAGESWLSTIKESSKQHSLVLPGRLEFGQTNGIVQF